MVAKTTNRVAVIIPVYAAEFLSQAVESVMGQTRPPDEVVLIDDGSPDQATIQAVESAWGSRLKVLHQANSGAGAARNAGIAATTADWIAFLDGDDRWLPHFLEQQMKFLETHPDVDLVWGDATIVGDTPAAGRTFMSMCPSDGPVTLESLLAQTCNVLTSTVVVRRELVLGVGGFDVALRRGQDFDLWLRLVSHGARAAYQRQVLAIRRLHGKNLSGTRLTELERALHVFDKAIDTLPLTRTERATAERRIRVLTAEEARERGKAQLASGDFATAFKLLDEAARTLPGWKIRFARFGVRYAPNLVRRIYLSRAAAMATGVAVCAM